MKSNNIGSEILKIKQRVIDEIAAPGNADNVAISDYICSQKT